MPLTTTRELLGAAVASGRGVAAFNVITLEHAEAIAIGAEEAAAAVILQISENAVAFHAGRLLPIAVATIEVARLSAVPVAVHLDHVEDESLLHQCASAGLSSVMFDASHLDFADNVAATRAAADWGHSNGLFVEAELGKVGGKGGAHAPGVRTDPAEAAAFVDATGVDALAVAVGSSHAMLKRTAELDLDLIGRLADAVSVPLVLHGSSGVSDESLRGAVGAGIVKVNIGTIINSAYTDAVRRVLADDTLLVDPRTYLRPARDQVAKVVAHMAALVSRTADHVVGEQIS